MGVEIASLEPKEVWSFFHEITKYPRPSKKEEKIVAYVEQLAAELGYPLKKDELGNIVITKPASPGMENRKPVVIQAHLDMVTEKNRDVEFDFENDSIQTYIDDGWVKAKGTTLGADNGMGVAMGMAVLASKDIKHPPYELLLTLDEETGLTGAIQLGTDLLKSEILINLDTEDDHTFSIGCAGGLNTIGHFPFERKSIYDSEYSYYEVGVKGLMGGHSGIEIHEGRAAATKLLTRLLFNLHEKYDVLINSMDSGNKHNAIPREGFAKVAIPSNNLDDALKMIETFKKRFQNEYKSLEKNLDITVQEINSFDSVFDKDSQERILRAFMVMPHGVFRMSPDIEGLVQTSTNFAVIKTKENEVEILTSQRSSSHTEKMYFADIIMNVIDLGGGKAVFSDGYPSWEPNMDSPILNVAKKIHQDIFGSEPVVEAIHAGLECGLIGDKYPNMDMLSFGPTIKEPHTPDEKIEIVTVENTWKLLLGILENIPEKN